MLYLKINDTYILSQKHHPVNLNFYSKEINPEREEGAICRTSIPNVLCAIDAAALTEVLRWAFALCPIEYTYHAPPSTIGRSRLFRALAALERYSSQAALWVAYFVRIERYLVAE